MQTQCQNAFNDLICEKNGNVVEEFHGQPLGYSELEYPYRVPYFSREPFRI